MTSTSRIWNGPRRRLRRREFQVKAVKDFREIIADKSIDAVCISTPDHWHAYMTVEACKAGKDVYVEKPACVYVEEGQKMVEAARKYKRVVQAGTMQRSGGYFQKAAEIVKSGGLGEITFCHAWQSGLTKQEGEGNPAGRQPSRGPGLGSVAGAGAQGALQREPLGSHAEALVHIPLLLGLRRRRDDGLGRPPDRSAAPVLRRSHAHRRLRHGQQVLRQGQRETPDTMLATFHYPKFLASYESRTCNPMPMFGNQGAASSIHGTEATLIVSRSGCWVTPNGRNSKAAAVTCEKDQEMAQMNLPHWKNFLACIKSREKPTSDIETCVRSSTACLLANLSMRFKTRLDWDEKNWTVLQKDARHYLKARYRKPWKLEV